MDITQYEQAEAEAVEEAEAREEMEAALAEHAPREAWTWAREDAAEHAGEAAFMAAFGD